MVTRKPRGNVLFMLHGFLVGALTSALLEIVSSGEYHLHAIIPLGIANVLVFYSRFFLPYGRLGDTLTGMGAFKLMLGLYLWYVNSAL